MKATGVKMERRKCRHQYQVLRWWWTGGGHQVAQSSLVVATILCFVVGSVAGKFADDCVKEPAASGSSDVTLSCRLRTINSEFDKTNFSEIASSEYVTSLSLECSDVVFYQSSLQAGSLSHLSRLGSLHIEHCKLSRLDPTVFSGLNLLKNLTIRTYNTAWPALSLEIASGAFETVPTLEKIDLSANNIWTFPEKLFCQIRSLEYLNVSSNRLQDISDLSFRDGGSGSALSTAPACKPGLRVLDVSRNRLIVMPARALVNVPFLEELYLEGNELSNVADRALSGLKNLRILNLADNKVVALPLQLFTDTKEISEIYLQNNSLSTIPPSLFANLDQLVVLDLSYNILTSGWMNQSGAFSGLIRLVLLRLGHNRLTRLDPASFQDLYSLQILNLEHNQITAIDANTFSAMSNLHTLVLSHNKIQAIEATSLNGLFVLSTLSLDNNGINRIHAHAFHNCSSLKDLNLNGNGLGSVPVAIQNLTQLKTIDLGENTIDQLESPRLIGLPALYGLRLTGNRITNVSKTALKELPSLKILNLARNRINTVEPGSFDMNLNLQAVRLDANYLQDINNLFAQSPNLIWLNISDNQLTWFDYGLIPKQLQWLDLHKNGIGELANYYGIEDLRLQTLDASFNRITKINALSLPDSLENLFLNDNIISVVDPHTFYRKSNLSRVDMYANQIESMDLKALQLSPFPGDRPLPEFYIAGNPILCDCNMEWLQRINKMDHLRQHPRVMDLDSVYCKLVYHRDKYFVPLAEAEAAQFLCSYKTHCFALCHCCEFDACDCQMTCPGNCTCFHDDTWSANIVDCAARGHTGVPARLPMDSTEVYLDGNYFEELTSHVFIGRKNLKVLYLNNSHVQRIQNNTFSGLRRLEVLHLENNFLTDIFGYEFEPLESLRELYLSGNQIQFISNTSFIALRMLEVLQIDNNHLAKFTLWSLSSNPYLVEIGLNGNPWSCECDFVSSAAPWIQSNKGKIMDVDNVNCQTSGRPFALVYMVNGNGTKCTEIVALSGAVEAPETKLPAYLPLLAGVMAVCLVIGSLLVAVCRKRRAIRIWASGKCPFQCYSAALDEDREKLYDAYIAYSVKDEAWVTQVLAPELSQPQNGSCGSSNSTTSSSSGSAYRLCLHYKDFPVSAYISDTIVEAVESSRKTIMVLSKNFLQSEWCRFEFKSALHAALRGKKNKLIAVTLGDLPTRDLDPDLRVCLRSATVLSANDKLFWHKLKCALPEPRISAYTTSSLINMNLPRQQSHISSTLNFPHHPHHQGQHHPHNTLHHPHHNFNHGTLSRSSPVCPLPPAPPLSFGGNNGVTASGTLNNTLNGNANQNVPLFVPPFPPPPFPAPRRPPPPAPLWTP